MPLGLSPRHPTLRTESLPGLEPFKIYKGAETTNQHQFEYGKVSVQLRIFKQKKIEENKETQIL